MRCALELDNYARRFVIESDAAALGFGATRIGVHSGSAVVGNFGGEAFFDYTAHGDVINTAARMESANKHLGTTVCVSGDTARQCPEIKFRPIGRLLLQGKDHPVDAFEPVEDSRSRLQQFSDYLCAYTLMVEGREDAGIKFRELAQQYPDDALITLHTRRLASGESGPFIVMNEK